MNEDPRSSRRSAYLRPSDPAGTRPKVDPDAIVPQDLAPLLIDAEAEAEAVEIDEFGQEIGADAAVLGAEIAGDGDAVAGADVGEDGDRDGDAVIGADTEGAEEDAGPAAVPAPATLVAASAPPPPISHELALRTEAGGLARLRSADAPQAPRFQFLLGALLALGFSAVLLTVVLLIGSRESLPPKWSTWQPTSPGYSGAQQIANFVGPEYRLANNQQLAAISGGPPVIAGVPVTLALSSGATGNITALSDNGVVLYSMCGLGTQCTILGTPSAQRLLLVKREALELALYTFHYLGASDVVVLIPPVLVTQQLPGKPATHTRAREAIFFRAGDLSRQVTRPLYDTLTRTTPTVANVATSPDAPIVSEITTPKSYSFNFVQSSQNGSLFMVLQQ